MSVSQLPSGGAQSGTSALLAVVSYSHPTTTYSTSSATLADVDASNLVITFTAPSSGKVIVVISAHMGAAAGDTKIGLRDSGGDVATSMRVVNFQTVNSRFNYRALMSGLTPGNSYTWKMSWAVTTGTATLYTVAASHGPALLEVWSAP